ncbi:MAG: DUF7948 domain-containing protein [Planctomycetota bacterium]|jgi:hypothetical protein
MPRLMHFALIFCALSFATASTVDASDETVSALPGGFVENVGQHEQPVRFVAQRGGTTAWLTDEGFVIQLLRASDGVGRNLSLDFERASDDVTLTGVGEPGGLVNSYRGQDRSRWISGARTWPAVRYLGVRPGVDVLVRDGAHGIEYDLELAPGADLDSVVMRLAGADALLSADEGRALVAHTAAGPLTLSIPASWQVEADGARTPLDVRVVLLDDERFTFAAPGRDADRPLVVDPALTYGTFLGGSIWDRATDVVDLGDGKVIVSGFTTSPTFPTTPGAFQQSLVGSSDAFVCKLDLDAGAIVYSTLLGGTDAGFLVQEVASALALASDGSVYATGTSNCFDFPTTTGAYKETNSGGTDAWAAKFGPGGVLHWSTILGGGKNETGTDIALAADGVVVVGYTFSDGGGGTLFYPTTPGAYDQTFSSIFLTNDGFVTKLALDGSSLVWSTMLGGLLRDEVMGVAVNPAGAVYVTGFTGSAGFPTTAGAFDETFNGPSASETDAFVTKLTANGSNLAWSTFLGGADIVEANAIALDVSDAPIIVGFTRGADLPTTTGALSETFEGGLTDAFVAHFLPDGSDLDWLTYLGGENLEEALDVEVDAFGVVTVAGYTESPDFPLSPGAYDATMGQGEAFVTRLRSEGDAVAHSTFFGGANDEEALGLALDAHGAAIIAGQTDSFDMAVTPNAVDGSYATGGDAFVARLEIPPWADVGFALAGTGGLSPRLVGTGTLEVGTPGSLTLTDGKPNSLAFLFGGVFNGNAPFKGGTLVPFPAAIILQVGTLPDGSLPLGWLAWPPGLPAGIDLYLQVWISDPGAVSGASASNAVRGTQP